MNRKGATFAIGQVLVFLISVGIFLTMFFVFNGYQAIFNEINTANQLDEVKEIVVSNIIKLSQKRGNTTTYIKMEFGKGSLPSKIGVDDYSISFYSRNVTIDTSSGFTVSSYIYGINESITLSGRVFSTTGSFVIYKSGERIIISNSTIY